MWTLLEPHLPGRKGAWGGQAKDNRQFIPDKRGLNTKLHLAVDAPGLPVQVVVTPGTPADCTQAIDLMAGISATHLLADRGYDSEVIIEQAKTQGMAPVIPPRKNRKRQRAYDSDLYRWRHLIENAFLHLKRWRGIAIWAKISSRQQLRLFVKSEIIEEGTSI